MRNKLSILKPAHVFADPDPKSAHIDTISPNTIVDFTREKRRNSTNWIEIYREGTKKAYIKKSRDGTRILDIVKLNDEKVYGFSVTNQNSTLPIQFSVKKIEPPQDGGYKKPITGFQHIPLGGKNPHIYEYSERQVELKPLTFTRGEQFYVMNKSADKKDPFIQVNNFNGKEGFLLKSANYTSLEDAPFILIGKLIVVAIVMLIILSILTTGWLVISGLFLIPAIIIAVIVAFSLQGIYNMIRKRL